MEHTDKDFFLPLLDKFIATSPTAFFVSVPVSNNSLLNDFPRFVFMESGELDCDIGQNGSIETVHLPEHSMLFGMKGASTGCSDQNIYDGKSLTIGFFNEYIRLVFYSFLNGKPVDFVYYHTAMPLCNAGYMALESLRSIAMNSELFKAKTALMKAVLEITRYQLQNPHTEKIGKSLITWQKIETYIEQHFQDESLSRKSLAKQFRLNESYLSTLCHANTKHTLHDLIMRKKLEYSLLLLEQNLTIGEIAAHCGFNQTGYFIQVFRKTYGISPGKYRNNTLRNE